MSVDTEKPVETDVHERLRRGLETAEAEVRDWTEELQAAIKRREAAKNALTLFELNQAVTKARANLENFRDGNTGPVGHDYDPVTAEAAERRLVEAEKDLTYFKLVQKVAAAEEEVADYENIPIEERDENYGDNLREARSHLAGVKRVLAAFNETNGV